METFYITYDGIIWGGLVIALLAATVNALAADDPHTGIAPATGGFFLVSVLTLLYGLRPVHAHYIDMLTYERAFRRYARGGNESSFTDPLFDRMYHFAASIMSVELFFFLVAIVYIVGRAIGAKMLVGPRWPLLLATMASSFHFYAHGTNVIRAGMAGSFALIAIASSKWWKKILLFLVAAGIHLSMLLPMAAHLAATRIRDLRIPLAFWFLCIPASLFLPTEALSGFAERFGETRGEYFLEDGEFQRRYRFDFILYSSAAVAAICGWKWIAKYEDERYELIAKTYLLANGAWILVNDVAFSDRFAYLSWFLIEIVFLYPLLTRPRLARTYAWPAALAIIIANVALGIVALGPVSS